MHLTIFGQRKVSELVGIRCNGASPYASIANKTLQTGSNVLVCCIFQCTMKDKMR